MLLLITWSWVLLSVLILNHTWLPVATEVRRIYDIKVRVRCKGLNNEKQRRCSRSGPFQSSWDSTQVLRPAFTLIKSPQRN